MTNHMRRTSLASLVMVAAIFAFTASSFASASQPVARPQGFEGSTSSHSGTVAIHGPVRPEDIGIITYQANINQYDLAIHSDPHVGHGPNWNIVGWLGNHDVITIACQTRGETVFTDLQRGMAFNGHYYSSDLWDQLGSGDHAGAYVPDSWVYTDTSSQVAPTCEMAPVPGSRPTVVIQAGHVDADSNCHPNLKDGGAPGEAQWTREITSLVVDKLRVNGIDATYANANLNCVQDPTLNNRHYNAAVAIHYQGPGILGPRHGYVVSHEEPMLGTDGKPVKDPAEVQSEMLAHELSNAYWSSTQSYWSGVNLPHPHSYQESSYLLGNADWVAQTAQNGHLDNLVDYYLKYQGYPSQACPLCHHLSDDTPFALIEAGVGAPGFGDRNDSDFLHSQSGKDEVVNGIAYGIMFYLDRTFPYSEN